MGATSGIGRVTATTLAAQGAEAKGLLNSKENDCQTDAPEALGQSGYPIPARPLALCGIIRFSRSALQPQFPIPVEAQPNAYYPPDTLRGLRAVTCSVPPPLSGRGRWGGLRDD